MNWRRRIPSEGRLREFLSQLELLQATPHLRGVEYDIRRIGLFLQGFREARHYRDRFSAPFAVQNISLLAALCGQPYYLAFNIEIARSELGVFQVIDSFLI